MRYWEFVEARGEPKRPLDHDSAMIHALEKDVDRAAKRLAREQARQRYNTAKRKLRKHSVIGAALLKVLRDPTQEPEAPLTKKGVAASGGHRQSDRR